MSLLDNAKKDLCASEALYEKVKQGQTDLYMNNVCYHLQQCLEKELKYLLNAKFVEYPYNHDIYQLASLTRKHYSDDERAISAIDKVLQKANAYTSWESQSRYNDSFGELQANVDEAFELCRELADICAQSE